jgi:hypothetical protein
LCAAYYNISYVPVKTTDANEHRLSEKVVITYEVLYILWS